MGPASVFEGREGLEVFFGQVVPGAVSFCMHMVHNAIIEVDGDRASGTWYYEAPTTDASSNRAQWMAGTYLEEYAREDGEWKFTSIETRWKYISPYDEGWAKNPGKLLALRSFIAVFGPQDYGAALDLAAEALQLLEEDLVYWRVVALWVMAESQERTRNVTEAIATLREARRTGRLLAGQLFFAPAELFLATTLQLHGQRR